MQNSSRRSFSKKSGNSINNKRENGSKRNSLSAKKSERRVAYTKRIKLKPRSHAKATDLVKSNRRSSNFYTNQNGRSSTKRSLPENLQKVSSICSLKKQSSSRFKGGKSLSLSCKKHGKSAEEEDQNQRKGQMRKRKRKKQNIVRDEASRLQRRTRYLLIRMKLEQNLIDAYSGEGWKGNSREKIKPEKELERAKKQILECKLGIRDVIRQLDLISSDGRIEDSVIDPDGRVFHEYIFCAKCKLREAFPDNDIILCDGTCNRAFHQKCLEPPLATENIPPGDQGWFCKYCECKMEILEAVNAHLGTTFSGNCSWQDVFKEAVNAPESEKRSFDPTEEWPSEDSEDDDYDPETFDKNCNKDVGERIADDAGSSSGLFWSSDEASSVCEGSPDNNSNGVFSKVKSRRDLGNFRICEPADVLDSDNTDEVDTLNSRRHRKDVDYKKLHDEMFGKEIPENEELSEDEDWGPCRRKRRVNESHADMTRSSCADEDSCLNVKANVESREELLTETRDKKALFRIPASAVETLRRVFSENELPSRDVKENLSKKLGIASEKINKWFKNARYMALKTRKAKGTNKLRSSIQRLNRETEIRGSAEKPPLDKSSLVSCSVALVPSSSRIVNWKKSSKSRTLTSKKHHSALSGALRAKAIEELTAVLRVNQSPSIYTKRKLSKQLGLPYRQVSMWFNNARIHKKSSLERKICPEKERHISNGSPVKETNIDEQMYLVQLERLFSMEDRLHKLKRELEIYTDKNHTFYGTSSTQPTVVYVPIVELREKL
ncbi:pathogenesis-related homeodomain protein-like [Aristolochia californica]|uniref:pathogenesis-related homeodomain protein-like n=1 Tax=Aristolochia californica TaxID=171875 RepID=UPI0035DF88F1